MTINNKSFTEFCKSIKQLSYTEWRVCVENLRRRIGNKMGIMHKLIRDYIMNRCEIIILHKVIKILI